ncbi:MAG: depupylase/deamidase Dop [Actinomycetaceae bacterium]|nr:depupylase/deamidase Dop [Actinomycetaceae bacterium]
MSSETNSFEATENTRPADTANVAADTRPADNANMADPASARVIGTETEFGVIDAANPGANPVVLSAQAVETYAAAIANGEIVRWDYSGEDPLNDARGYRLERASAHPSMLTDDPYRLAPSGGVEYEERPGEYERFMQRATSVVLPNGGRFYVDHAHPEYSSPETTDPLTAVLYDRAGDRLAVHAMREARADGLDLVLYKNNTDGKGASYGTHENYQVPREVDFDDLVRVLIPFFVTRPIICGSGRVGLGQRGERAGFQISQRADFVENEVGLETTFNRPIINTRDEPHAFRDKYRRLHVINGDANQFDVSTYLRVGTTSLVLRALEGELDLSWEGLALDQDPVKTAWLVSHDVDMRMKIDLKSGRSVTAIELQRMFLELVRENVELTEADQRLVSTWERVLHGLENDLASVASDVEWVGKYLLFERQRERLQSTWDDPRLAAMDLQWADLRPEKSLVAALDRAGRVTRLFDQQAVEDAVHNPPAGTRAHIRGLAISIIPQVVKASWTSIVVDQPEHLVRIPLPEPGDEGSAAALQAIEAADADQLIRLFT